MRNIFLLALLLVTNTALAQRTPMDWRLGARFGVLHNRFTPADGYRQTNGSLSWVQYGQPESQPGLSFNLFLLADHPGAVDFRLGAALVRRSVDIAENRYGASDVAPLYITMQTLSSTYRTTYAQLDLAVQWTPARRIPVYTLLGLRPGVAIIQNGEKRARFDTYVVPEPNTPASLSSSTESRLDNDMNDLDLALDLGLGAQIPLRGSGDLLVEAHYYPGFLAAIEGTEFRQMAFELSLGFVLR